MRRLFLLVCGLALSGCGLIFSSSGGNTVIIAPDEVGVLVNTFNGDIIDTLQPGTHALLPDNAVTIYSTTQQQFSMRGALTPPYEALEVLTSDGQSTLLDIIVLFRIDTTHVIDLYQAWGDGYVANFVDPITSSTVREVVAIYTAEDLCCEGRIEITHQIRSALTDSFRGEGLILEGFLIPEITFSEAFNATMEAQALFQLEGTRVQEVVRATQTMSALTGQLLDNDLAIRIATLEAENFNLRATLNALQVTPTATPRP